MSTQGEKERSKETLFRSCRRLFYTHLFLFSTFYYDISFFLFIVVPFVDLFKFLQLPHGRRLRHWCCPFLPSHTLGDEPQRMTWLRMARRKPSEYLPESLRADSPAWLTSPVATPKRTPLNDGCRLWGLGGTKGKASRHPTFCISRIVAGTTGQIQRVVC